MMSSPASPSGSENRAAPRRPASAVPTITGMRISPRGADAVLVNISNTGLLAECGERVQTGSNVTVIFEGGFTPRSIEGRVTRNSVSSMANGRLRYHVGIAFNKPIVLEDLAPEPEAPAAAADAAPPTPEPAPAPVAAAPVVAAPEPAPAAPTPVAPTPIPTPVVPAPVAPPPAARPPVPTVPLAAARQEEESVEVPIDIPLDVPPPAPAPLRNRW
jgi:PilZ domain-containing protein